MIKATSWLASTLAVGIGLLSALLASYIPARSVTRQDAMQSVRSAEAATTTAKRPVVGLALLTLGLVAGSWSLIRPAAWQSLGGGVVRAKPELVVIPAVIACVLLFVGLLLCTPYLLDVVGRRPFGGLATRLALRDAGRNRSRAVACVASAMAITTLAGAFVTVSYTLGRAEMRDYEPSAADGFVHVSAYDDGQAIPASQQKIISSTVAQHFGGELASRSVRQANGLYVEIPMEGYSSMVEVLIGGPDLVSFLTRKPVSAGVAQALDQGKVVVFDKNLIHGGALTLVVEPAMPTRHPSPARPCRRC